MVTCMEQDLVVLPLDRVTGSWDDFVGRAEGSSFCHLAAWRDILSDVLGAECLYRVVVDRTGAWHGVLPLARVRSWLFGHYLVSLPFLNDGGPLGSPEARRQLVEDAVAEARRSRVDLLELRTRDGADLELPVSSRKTVPTVLMTTAMVASTARTRAAPPRCAASATIRSSTPMATVTWT